MAFMNAFFGFPGSDYLFIINIPLQPTPKQKTPMKNLDTISLD
jgi:hypothetical protein